MSLLAELLFPRDRWAGCHAPSPAERMARYSKRHAEDMQQRENLGAAPIRARIEGGHAVLVSLPGRINRLPNQLPDESHAEYEARMQRMREARRTSQLKDQA